MLIQKLYSHHKPEPEPEDGQEILRYIFQFKTNKIYFILQGAQPLREGTPSRRNISRDAINRRNHAKSGVMCRDVISRERDPKKK